MISYPYHLMLHSTLPSVRARKRNSFDGGVSGFMWRLVKDDDAEEEGQVSRQVWSEKSNRSNRQSKAASSTYDKKYRALCLVRILSSLIFYRFIQQLIPKDDRKKVDITNTPREVREHTIYPWYLPPSSQPKANKSPPLLGHSNPPSIFLLRRTLIVIKEGKSMKRGRKTKKESEVERKRWTGVVSEGYWQKTEK